MRTTATSATPMDVARNTEGTLYILVEKRRTKTRPKMEMHHETSKTINARATVVAEELIAVMV